MRVNPNPETCMQCGTPIVQNPVGREKLFCTVSCKQRNWRRKRAGYDQ